MGEAAFCLAYSHTARRLGWTLSLAAGCAAFALAAAALRGLTLPLFAVAVMAFVALTLALRAMPAGGEARATATPRWDIPVRMATATAVVVLITETAPMLGPRLSGVLGAFPVYAAILTVFGHRSGAAAAVQVLRGLLIGLFGFAGFFIVLGSLIERTSLLVAFAVAIAITLAIQTASFHLMLRSPARGIAP